MKVLIVDDEEDVRRIATLSLSRVGQHEVVEASSGHEAISLARLAQPDVILLDVMMPEMDGPTTLAALKADPRTSSIDVVFVTARALVSELRELRALGARGVLTKPFDAMSLPGQLREVLGGTA